jgi:6-phosphogluconolactonase
MGGRALSPCRGFFNLSPCGAVPHFDIIHRGMGPDTRMASLFPGDPLIDDNRNLMGAVYPEKFPPMASHSIEGSARSQAEPLLPAQISTYNGGGAMWFLDKMAARVID